MASTKNANNNSNNTSVDASGFKTVAFGFDKNDVTMYIASLRKKMKAMEEEFEHKLSQALNNPAVSNDALKHEREVIRAETEKQWNDKILEHTSVIKKQQDEINELEIQLSEKNDTIQSLKAQLAAATSSDDPDAGTAASAKAAEAYMRFTAELRAISESAQRTLDSIEQVWSGEFGASAAEQYAPMTYAAQVSMPATPAKAAAAYEPFNKAAEERKPASASNDLGFNSLIADDDEDDLISGLISDVNDDDETKAAVSRTPAPTPVPAPAPVKAEIPDEFASLLADSDADEASGKPESFDIAPAATVKGAELDTDLLSDIVITPGEQHNGNLGKMLEEKEQNEFDAFKDLFVSESNAEENKDDFADLTITPIAETEYKPGISTEFDLKVDDTVDMSGLEDFVVSANEEPAVNEVKAAPEPPPKKEEDLFDFSFLVANDDEEDDMSSDVSFNGML